MQAQKIAGHAHVDMTGAYTLDDRDRARDAQSASIRSASRVWCRSVQKLLQMGQNGPKRRETWGSPRLVHLNLLLLCGGPDRTRICDLYRVKVAVRT